MSSTTRTSPTDAINSPQHRPASTGGRMVIVPLSVLVGAAAVGRMFVLARTDGDTYATVSGIAAVALTGMFYCLLIWSYLRRDRASATTTKPAVLVAAPMATFLPLTLPHLANTAPSMAMVVLGDLLLLGGLVFSVWSVGHLSRCLSVLPQARTLVDRGPYQFVRHPLYSGEIVSMLGLALALGGHGAPPRLAGTDRAAVLPSGTGGAAAPPARAWLRGLHAPHRARAARSLLSTCCKARVWPGPEGDEVLAGGEGAARNRGRTTT